MTVTQGIGLTRTSIIRLPALIAALFAVTACTTVPARNEIPPFRQGVATVHQQSSSAFAEVNRFLREQQIERAMRQPALTEELFMEALGSADLAKWDRAFALIDSYAEKLERLLNPDQRAGVEGEISALGEKIEALGEEQLPIEFTSAFTKFGGFLIQIKAEKNALQAIRSADPAIQIVFKSMMEAIGADRGAGVRGTMNTSWTQILKTIDVMEFRKASSDSAKRAAIDRFLNALEERDAQDLLLTSIRLSLATLAKSHHELAEGRPVTAGALVQIIQDEYKAYRERFEAARQRRAAAATSGSST